MNRIDHIVVAAATLAQGVDFIRATLGVETPRGGVHQTMGTHNLLLQLGNEAYLEVVAIDPDGKAPARPRWFDLDQALLRTALEQRPRLITWVVNTPDLAALIAAASFDLGVATALTRDQLSWEFSLPDDGRLFGDGLLPYCIQWHSQPHPSRGMADLGCRLLSLTLHHNRPDWFAAHLESLGASHLVRIDALPDQQAPYLSASIDTPKGLVILK